MLCARPPHLLVADMRACLRYSAYSNRMMVLVTRGMRPKHKNVPIIKAATHPIPFKETTVNLTVSAAMSSSSSGSEKSHSEHMKTKKRMTKSHRRTRRNQTLMQRMTLVLTTKIVQLPIKKRDGNNWRICYVNCTLRNVGHYRGSLTGARHRWINR